MSTKRTVLATLALLALAPFLVSDTLGARGGKKPKPPPPPADPAIAYTTNGSPGVWVMNADGSNQTEIWHSPDEYVCKVSWSGDGKSIAFAGHGLWRIDVSVVGGVPTGSNATLLVGDGTVYPVCAWSPTRDEIAYIADVDGCELRVVSGQGGDPVTVYTAGPEDLNGLAWSPDGTEIACLERAGDDTEWRTLRIVEVSTGLVRKTLVLPQSPGHVGGRGHLSWARTRNEVAYMEVTEEQVNRKKTVWVETVRALDLETGDSSSVVQGRDPCWAPDDSQMLVSGIRLYDFASGSISSLTSEYGRDPDWKR